MRTFLKSFKSQFSNTVKTNIYLIKFVISKKCGKTYVFLKAVSSLIAALFPIVLTVFPGLIINELIYDRNISKIILFTSILVLCPALNQIFNISIGRLMSKIEKELHLQTTTDFYFHLSQLDIEYRENPDVKTKEDIARNTLENAAASINSVFGLISSMIGLLALIAIVSILNPFIMALVIANVILCSIITKKANDKQNETTHEYYKLMRYINIFEIPAVEVHYAKEVSLFGLTKYFIEKYRGAQRDSDRLSLKREGYIHRANLLVSIFNMVQEIVFYVYMIINVFSGNMLVGSMSIFLSAAHQFSNSIGTIFNQYIEMQRKNQEINDTIEYMNMPLIKMKSGTMKPIFDGNSVIEFKNVSFSYPGTDFLVLKNVNIKIRANEHLCIVGANGAGKSTFIKLLIRMYRPTEGSILLNGVDIYEYDYHEYWRLFSPVFQENELFGGISFRDNIILADEYDSEKFERVCSDHALHDLIQKMPRGVNTTIDKWVDEDGVTPSGGETQKMTIARAIYHGGEIFLLDEPTAALDPISEYEVYEQFNEMIGDKCAVLITHRLSAVQLADKVAVFDQGSVVEYGTHTELYANGGIYTEMFDKQAKFYRDKPS